MKKLQNLLLILAVVGLVLSFTGCPEDDGNGDEFARFYERTFNQNHLGNVTVINPTGFDMLLFDGEALIPGNIIGAVRANNEIILNFSDRPNFNVGAPALIRAVRQSVFEANRSASRPDHSAFIVYGNNRPATTTIVSVTDGDFRYFVTNRSPRFSLELRQNGWTGERVAFLGRGQMDVEIRTQTAQQIGLFPVWVGFNNRTQSMVTFEPLDIPLSAQPAFPRPPGQTPHEIFFPAGGSNVIEFPIDFPTAVIRVVNNTDIGATFRASVTSLRGHSGYVGLIPGVTDSFEIEADILGFDLNFLVGLAMDNIRVPVRFADAPNVNPVLENGWFYTVQLNHIQGQPTHLASSYEAILVRQFQQASNDVITSF